MPTPLKPRRTVFTDVNDAHLALFSDDVDSPTIELIPVTVDATKDVMTTEVRLMLGVEDEYHVIRGRGTATRAHGDVYDARVAARISLARSLDAISAKLKRQANGFMDENEWVQSDQARRKQINAAKSARGRLEAEERRLEEEIAEETAEEAVEKLYGANIPDSSVDAIINSLAIDDGTRRTLEGLFGRKI